MNFSVLTFVAIGACFLLPAYAQDFATVDTKIYVVRHVKTAESADYVIGVLIALNEIGQVTFAGFGMLPEQWDEFTTMFTPQGLTFEEVSRLEDLPIEGLRETFKTRPELYSEVLPGVLGKYSLQIVADELPGELLATLTPEAKAKIAPKVLEDLEKLYADKKKPNSK